ncbi:MAG TPA: tetratricopeptide repeat protein [Candidatus Babeliales bacterium]|jgi:Ca-activated chloride channel family protein|nr:tetratricopeptide repeat protein [Candidatus Babeliales bacterium]
MYSFSYDLANYAAQQGKWKDAHAQLNNIIINNPDSADVLHDAGVAAYKLGDFDQAVTCFARAAECAHDDNLRFDAYFKGGNASVDAQDLQGALELYDKALVIKPDDEYARHNRDRVKQMQDEQKKDEQKDKQEENDKKENKENKENQDKKDKQEQNQQRDQQNQDKKDQGDKDDASAQDSAEKGTSDKESQGNQGDDAEHGDKDAQRQEHGDKKQQQKKPADDKKGNRDHKLDEKPDNKQSERDKQQGDKHGKTPEKQKEEKQHATNDTTSVASGGEQEQGKDDNKFGIDDPWLLNLLNNQELRDKAINKQLMEAKIHQHGGKNGQNCW